MKEGDQSFLSNVKATGRLAFTFARHPEGAINFFTRGDKPIGASIDIAANCNLRCQHCYLFGKEHQEEGVKDDLDFLKKVQELRIQNPTIAHATWVGGEPMFRKELLRKAVQFFPSNWVVTNGTIPIDGEWENTSFFISVDGTEETHNRIRQPWKQPLKPEQKTLYNPYQKAKKTAETATAPVFIHTVINRSNAHTIPNLVAEWKSEKHVGGFEFSLHTPMVEKKRPSGMTENDEKLYLDGQEREDAIKMLHNLRQEYGDFVLMSHAQIDSYLPENQQEVFGSNCRVVKGVYSVDSQFNRKQPCVMGEGMDCSKCGCVIPTMLDRFAKFDPNAIRATFKTIASQNVIKQII